MQAGRSIVGYTLPGYTLLHQFETTSGYVLVTDFDCPFEERTNFVLLGPTLRMRSCRSLGGWYTSALLKDIEVIDDRRLVAIFSASDHFLITIRTWGIPVVRPRLKLERRG